MTRPWVRAGVTANLLFCFLPLALAVEVQEVRVESLGSGRMDPQSIRAHISLKVGDPFTRSAVSRDVKALQKTRRFSYVTAEFEEVKNGIAVVYKVESKLKIRHLNIEGAKEWGPRKIRQLLELGVGDFVDEASLAVAAKKVETAYHEKYFYQAKVEWILHEEVETGTAEVVVQVKEGYRGRVKSIQFEGDEVIPSSVLRKAMQQRKSGFFSWLTKSGIYNPDILESDKHTLRSLYLDRGYLDVEVGDSEIEQVRRRKLGIVIPIRAGKAYHIGNIGLEGVTLFPSNEVTQVITLKSGDPASIGEIQRNAKALSEFYGNRGYIRTRIDPDLDVDLQQGLVDIKFKVGEGSLGYVRDIHIRGNAQTKDKVIRRELAIYPSDIFNEFKIQRSERRLTNLGYFSSVNTWFERTEEPDEYDLVFEVEEKKTGQFVIGFGLSSIDDLVGFAEVSQGNFDVKGWPTFTGAGQKLKIRTQLGTKRRDAQISFVEPWFLDRKLSLELDFFQHDRRFLSDDYDQRNTGGSIGLGKALGRHNRVNFKYRLEEIEVFDVDENASELIKAEEGNRTKSGGTVQLLHDSRDSFFVSTRGNRTTLTSELAGGPFAGDTDLYRLELRSSYYWSWWFDHVFNLRAWAAVVEAYGDTDRVPIFDRLFLGGARTIRGFSFRDVGPKDQNGEPVGGQTGWYVTTEYTAPLFSRVRGAIYYDAGMVYPDAYKVKFDDEAKTSYGASAINSSYGIGVRLDIPGFPLRLDYAWPLEADEFNDKSSGRFSFLLGYVF